MGYVKEFEERLKKRDFQRFLQLWEEYLTVDTTEAEEMYQILELIKASDLKHSFGGYVETALPMWKTIEDKESSYKVIRILFDLETTNSPELADIATEIITEKFSDFPNFRESLRLVGLRDRQKFQGALSNFDLLVHMDKGKFVYHTAGWGTGEIMDISPIREQITVEFENVAGMKDLSFKNAFNTLVPLRSESFLARRFADPDLLEAQAKEDPLEMIKLLLEDLGPKTASDIKDEMFDLVIPADEWAKWWQSARARLKKDPLIEAPKSIKEPFYIRDQAKSLKEHLHEVLHHKENLDQFIPILYAFIRDVPHALKEEDIKQEILAGLLKALNDEATTPENGLQLALFLDSYFNHVEPEHELKDLISQVEHPEKLLDNIGVMALKKRILQLISKERPDWMQIFLDLFFTPQPSMVREFLLTELVNSEFKGKLIERLEDLSKKPQIDPETLVWYFQKLQKDQKIPYGDKSGQCQFFDGLLILLNQIEFDEAYKDLTRKIYNIISGKRYEVVRKIIEGTKRPFLEEFLLLASKCHTFTDHDLKILRSLAAVVDPNFKEKKGKKDRLNPSILWTTQEGFDKTKDRLEHIGTVEVVDNAKEIEEARALGDLKENSEYKFALERRSRLQGELRRLSEEAQKARVITPPDVECDEVGVGNVVNLTDSNGEKVSFTLLGPWDASPEEHILSCQSSLAQEMMGKKVGDSIEFKNEKFEVNSIESIFGG